MCALDRRHGPVAPRPPSRARRAPSPRAHRRRWACRSRCPRRRGGRSVACVTSRTLVLIMGADGAARPAGGSERESYGTKMPWRTKQRVVLGGGQAVGPAVAQLDVAHLPDRALGLRDQCPERPHRRWCSARRSSRRCRCPTVAVHGTANVKGDVGDRGALVLPRPVQAVGDPERHPPLELAGVVVEARRRRTSVTRRLDRDVGLVGRGARGCRSGRRTAQSRPWQPRASSRRACPRSGGSRSGPAGCRTGTRARGPWDAVRRGAGRVGDDHRGAQRRCARRTRIAARVHERAGDRLAGRHVDVRTGLPSLQVALTWLQPVGSALGHRVAAAGRDVVERARVRQRRVGVVVELEAGRGQAAAGA